ncbi:MAG: hypothetical protein LUE11_07125 [Clostridia bacterium]|nr:hypothetical protein [Clostridia bacterium]
MKFEQAFYTSANKLLGSSDTGIGICAASSTNRSFLTLAGRLAGRYQREKNIDYEGLAAGHIEQMIAYSDEFQRFAAAIVGPRKRREGDKRPNGMCQVLIPEEGAKPEDVLQDFRKEANMTVPEGIVTDDVCVDVAPPSLQNILNRYQISKEAIASLLDLVYMSILKDRKTVVIQNGGEVNSEQAVLDLTRLLLLLVPQEMQNKISVGLHAVLNFDRVLLWCGTDEELAQVKGGFNTWNINSTAYTHTFAYDIAEMAMEAKSDTEVYDKLNTIFADYRKNVTQSINEQEMELAFARYRLEKADEAHPAAISISTTAWQYLYNRIGHGEKWSEDTYLLYICAADKDQILEEERFVLDFFLDKMKNDAGWEKIDADEQEQWVKAAVHCAVIYADVLWGNYLWICRQITDPDAKTRVLNRIEKLKDSPIDKKAENVKEFCKVIRAYSGWDNSAYWENAFDTAVSYFNNLKLKDDENENDLLETMDGANSGEWKTKIQPAVLKRVTSQETVKEFSDYYTKYEAYLDTEADKGALLDWGVEHFENSEDEETLLQTMDGIDSNGWKTKIHLVMLKRVTSQETVKEFSDYYTKYKSYLDSDEVKETLRNRMGELYINPVLKDRERLSKLAEEITKSWDDTVLERLNHVTLPENLIQLCSKEECNAVENRYIKNYYKKLYEKRTLAVELETRKSLQDIAGWLEERSEEQKIVLEDKTGLHNTFDEWDFESLNEQEKQAYSPKTDHMRKYYFENYISENLRSMDLNQLYKTAGRMKDICPEKDIPDFKEALWKYTKEKSSKDDEKTVLCRLQIWNELHEGEEMDFDFFGGILGKKNYHERKDILGYLKEESLDAANALFATTPYYTKEEYGKTVHKGKKIPLCYLIWFTYWTEDSFPDHLLEEMTLYYKDTASKHKIDPSWKLEELREQNLQSIEHKSDTNVLRRVMNYICLLEWDSSNLNKNKVEVLRHELSKLTEEQKKVLIQAFSSYKKLSKSENSRCVDFENQICMLLDKMKGIVTKWNESGKTEEPVIPSVPKDKRNEKTNSVKQPAEKKTVIKPNPGIGNEETYDVGQQSESSERNDELSELKTMNLIKTMDLDKLVGNENEENAKGTNLESILKLFDTMSEEVRNGGF